MLHQWHELSQQTMEGQYLDYLRGHVLGNEHGFVGQWVVGSVRECSLCYGDEA